MLYVKLKNLLKLKMLLSVLIVSVFLSGCGSTRVVFIDSQSQMIRVGPNVKGKAYFWNGEEWELSANKIEYNEGHFVAGLDPEEEKE
jgi:4-diphosphocytidyl-2C-methyl-D-erythritol kinase|tara:strand:- start:95 stop:355 length:261 start_codon:yes stop_codon:yes gene_type:complete